jgi:glutamate decarboxylase
VDASWGGANLFSDRHRQHYLAGIDQADSVTFNTHKLFGSPVLTSFLILQDERLLLRANALHRDHLTAYLFHEESAEENGLLENTFWDMSKAGIGCGRHADAFKFFLSWKHHGLQGLGEMLQHSMDMAHCLRTLVEQNAPQLKAVTTRHESEWINVCFWYVPSWLTTDEHDKLEDVTRTLIKHVNSSGNFLVCSW